MSVRFAALFALVLALPAYSAAKSPSILTPEQWREDLKTLDETIRNVHANPFHTVSEADHTAAVTKLEREIPQSSDVEILVELTSIVAAVNDGHTSMGGWMYDEAWGTSWYPIALYWFSDGLYVRQAASEVADLAGARVVQIGNLTAEEAHERVARMVAADNVHGKRFGTPFALIVPEVLEALGVIDDATVAPFLLEKDGRQWQPEITARKGDHPGYVRGFIVDPDWVDARDASDNPTPLWLRNVTKTFWYEYLPTEKTLYVQQNQVRDGVGETLESFYTRVFEFVESNDVQKMVLDVRLNGGGNNYLNNPAILGMIRTNPISEPGKSFTIIGRQTFSACQNLVNELSRYSETIFVGEPTGERVNFYGDNRAVELPNCGLNVRASYLWWQNMDPRDTRDALSPDLSTDLSFADYAANHDPAMQVIRDFEELLTADTLLATLESGGPQAALSQLRGALQTALYRTANLEAQINALGYRLLGDGRAEMALAMFQLNVDAFPESWNVYDSLAETYAGQGDTARAVELYRKSLELNPTSPTGLAALERLVATSSN